MTPGAHILYASVSDTVEIRHATVVADYCDELLVRERETGWTGTVRVVDCMPVDADERRRAVFAARLIALDRAVATREAA